MRYFKKSRRVETKKSKALKGDAVEAEKAPKAEPKAKKDAVAAPEKDAD